MDNRILSDEALRELMPVVGDEKCLNWARWGATKQFEKDSLTASLKDAEIAELTRKGELLCCQNGSILVENHDLKAKIKELEKYHQPEYETAILQQAKSESRSQAFREVGYEMMRHVRAESGLPPRWVADLIAKLQKGEI